MTNNLLSVVLYGNTFGLAPNLLMTFRGVTAGYRFQYIKR